MLTMFKEFVFNLLMIHLAEFFVILKFIDTSFLSFMKGFILKFIHFKQDLLMLFIMSFSKSLFLFIVYPFMGILTNYYASVYQTKLLSIYLFSFLCTHPQTTLFLNRRLLHVGFHVVVS